MGKAKRIRIILTSLITIVLSILLALNPENGSIFVASLIGLTLLVYGLQELIYYFNMARFKVEGRITLYIAVICLDLAVVTFGITKTHPQIIMLYLLLYYIFFGAIRIYSALDAKKLGAKSWRVRLASGILCLVISLLCILNFSSKEMMIYILCSGFIYSAILQIIMACRKTAIIYIQ